MDTTLTLIILLALVALACFALASGLLLGLVYVEYLCRPTVYRFNWPSDPTEDIKDVEDDSFVAWLFSKDEDHISIGPSRFKCLFINIWNLPSNIKSFIIELPLNIKGLYYNFFPRGPALLLTSPSGTDLTIPAATLPCSHGFIVISQPRLLHILWTAREAKAPHASATPILDAISDSIPLSTDDSSEFLQPVGATIPISHQWSSSCSLGAEQSPAWLGPGSSLPESSEITSSGAVEELPLPVQMAHILASSVNTTRPWSWPSTRTSNIIPHYQGSGSSVRPWSLPGAENLTPTLRESNTEAKRLIDSHKRMTALMFTTAARDNGRKEAATVDSRKRMSLLLEVAAKRDAMKNKAGVYTPPTTPTTDDIDLEAQWGQTAAECSTSLGLYSGEASSLKTNPGPVSPLSDGSGNLIIRNDEDEAYTPSFISGNYDSTFLSRKIGNSASKRVEAFKALKQVDVVAQDVDQNAVEVLVEYWMPEASVEPNEDKDQKPDRREYSVFGPYNIYTPLLERETRAKLFRDARKGISFGRLPRADAGRGGA